MTVITMPFAEKKPDNVPLVNNIEVDPSSAAAQAKDLEAGNVEGDRPVRSKFLVLRVINDRVYSMWTLVYVLLMFLSIMFMILYGAHIYKIIGNAFNYEKDAFYGTSTIALNDKLYLDDMRNADYGDIPADLDLNNIENVLSTNKMFNQMGYPAGVSEIKEDIEIGLKDDNYEKILPLLPELNNARFVHDFSANVTGIVDVEGQRCFVMPLDRSSVLPPKSLYDLLFKMSSGYYTLDTSNVMHNMRVVKPAVEDVSEYGIYIAKDCENFPTFKLEKFVSGVSKRSVRTAGKTFTEFSGRMESFNIVNYHDVDSSS